MATDDMTQGIATPLTDPTRAGADQRVFDVSKSSDAARAWALINNTLQNNTAFLGPGTPMQPIWEEEEPRWTQYTPGVNQNILPRAGWGLMSFQQLRNIAAACKEVRANIELIKRTMRGFDWDIAPVEDDEEFDSTELDNFFRKPDGLHDLKGWVELLLEDLLVLDANVIWPRMEGNKVVAADIISADTFRINIDIRGKVPSPPTPAYFQVIWGQPKFWATSERIIYSMMHPRPNAPYGKSPIEDMIAAINVAIRRDLQRIGAYTAGNVPHSFVGLPDTWTVEQIKEYQQYIDALIAGDESRTSKFIFIPHSSSNIPIVNFSKSDLDATQLDEFLMKVTCWFYGNSPAEFGITGGRGLGGSGFMQGMEDIQYRTSIDPVIHYIQDLVTYFIQTWLKRPDAKFVVQGVEPKSDQLLQAQIDQLKIQSNIYTAAFVQDREGVDQKYRPTKDTATLPAPSTGDNVDDNAQQNTNGVDDGDANESLLRAAVKGLRVDLKAWQETAERFFDKGWQLKPNTSPAIPDGLRKAIEASLQDAFTAKDRAQIKAIFDNAFDLAKVDEGRRVFGAYKKKPDIVKKKTLISSNAKLDERFERLKVVREQSAKRVISHIYPVMQTQKRKIELLMKEHLEKDNARVFLTKQEIVQYRSEEDKWRKEFTAALILALILSIGDIGDVENDIWSELGYDRISFNPTQMIAAYEQKVDRPLSDIADKTITDVNAILEQWDGTPESLQATMDALDKYFNVARATNVGDYEVGNMIGQTTLEVMQKHGLTDWRWRHLGEDIPCTNPITVDGKVFDGCLALNGQVFSIRVIMPPEASHNYCHCVPEPVIQ